MSFILMALLAGAAPVSPDAAIGTWKTETRNGIVEIQHCGTSICGRLVSSDALRANPDTRDAHNSDAAKRARPLKNLLMLSGFARAADAWTGGSIYNADDGKTYSARVTPISADQLKVRGCVFVPFCKTQTWTRVR